MTLTTAATATLGRLQYTTQITRVRAQLALLPATNVLELGIAGGVEVSAAPGDEAEVELDGGDGAAMVITGTVAGVRRGPRETVVMVVDGGAALARLRQYQTFEGLGASQVVSELADAAGVDTGSLLALGQTAAFVAHPRRTGAEQVAYLADLSGAVAAIDGDGRLAVSVWPIGLPTVAMGADREFLSIQTGAHAAPPAFAAIGSGGAGVALAPDAWVPSTAALTTSDDPGSELTWRSDPVLRAQVDVTLAQRGMDQRRAAATSTLRAECWLQPARRPGDVVQLQGSEGQEGPWLLTQVVHQLSPHGARTALRGVGVGASAGSLLDTVGGLL
jgi:hypothetical protein